MIILLQKNFMEPKIKIDGNKFYRRIEKIYKIWKSEVINSFTNQNSTFANCDNIIILRGNFNESSEGIQIKTSLLQYYFINLSKFPSIWI